MKLFIGNSINITSKYSGCVAVLGVRLGVENENNKLSFKNNIYYFQYIKYLSEEALIFEYLVAKKESFG